MPRTALRTSVSALAFAAILAACGQASADVPSPSQAPTEAPAPSQPARPSATPRPTPVPTPVPTVEPSAPPVERDPHQPTIVRHELPMVGRVTADGVSVRELPDLDAPLVTGRSTADLEEELLNLRLDAGHIIVVTAGPLFADGVSWYYAHAEGGPVAFSGWIAGEYLAREGDYSRPVVTGTVDGYGNGGTIELELRAGAPVVVTTAVNVVDGDDACHSTVDIVFGDGTVLPFSDGPVTGPMFGRAAPPDAAELVQTADGPMTLRVETDCSFAASMWVLD